MKKCKSNMSESFKRKSALHYALGGEVTQPPAKPASQGILAQPIAQHVRALDTPEAAPIMPNVPPMTAPAPSALNPGVPTLTNQELGSLGKNAAGTAPPSLWGAFKDRYGMGPSGYAHGGAVYSIPGEPGTATFPMHGAGGPSEMDLGAAALPGMDNPLRRGYQTGGMVAPPPRPQPVVAPPSITAPPAMPVAPPVAPPVAAPVQPGRLRPATTPFDYRNPFPSTDVVEGAVRGSKGGPVTDPGKGFPAEQGEDKHHIVVAAGEYVLPNATVDALGGAAALDKIVEATNGAPPNKLTGSNALRGYAGGGLPVPVDPVQAQRFGPPKTPPVSPLNMEAAARARAADYAAHVGRMGGAGPAPGPAPAAAAGPDIGASQRAFAEAAAKPGPAPGPTTAAGKAGAFAKATGEKVAGAANALKGAPGALARGAMGIVGPLAAAGAAGYAGYKGMGETTDEIAQRLNLDVSPSSTMPPTGYDAVDKLPDEASPRGANQAIGRTMDSVLRSNPFVGPAYSAVVSPARAHADEYTLGRDLAVRSAGFADHFTGGALGGVRKSLQRATGELPAQPAGAGNAQPTRVAPAAPAAEPTAPPPDWSQTGQRNPNPLRSSRVGNQVTITDGSTPEQQSNAWAVMDRRAASLRAADARDRATNPRYDPANIAAEHAAIESKYAAPAQTPGTIATSDGREVPIQSIEGKMIAGAQNRRMLAESPLRTAQISSATQRRGQDLVYDAAVQHRALERQLAMQRAKIEQFNKDRDYSAGRSDRAFEQDEKRTEAYNKILDNTFVRKGPKGEELGREERVRANELIMGTLQQAGVDPRTVSPQDFTEMARLAALDMATEKNREGVTGQLKTWVLGPFAKAQGLQGRRGPVQVNKGALVDTVTLPDGRVMTRREYEQGDPNLIINPPAHQRELDVTADAYGRIRNSLPPPDMSGVIDESGAFEGSNRARSTPGWGQPQRPLTAQERAEMKRQADLLYGKLRDR